ncbi:c-5 sterol desaturase [Dimargaris verticillata]|uniref:C-5 sterol desaturase n=1 Tax=Dimargaris verticillata TaxID=2761393 RepID=A0A9W8BBE2_9FUNG|nr:c-5 sterol desaturase [Dimargaris verticillata]
MDIVVEYADHYVTDGAYQWLADYTPCPYLERSHFARQYITVSLLVFLSFNAMYFVEATIAYYFIFDHGLKKHPKFLPHQVRREISASTRAFLPMSLLKGIWFVAEMRGYSLLYDGVATYGWYYLGASALMLLLFTDFCVYWNHRLLHHRWVYAKFHKPRHKWIIPTPYAAFAFHYLDGYLQSVPYHLGVFIFPVHKLLYLAVYFLGCTWAIMFHGGEYIITNQYLNASAHHNMHHLYFNYNYGQYFTLWDQMFGTYRHPSLEVTDGELRHSASVQKRQASEVDHALPNLEAPWGHKLVLE